MACFFSSILSLNLPEFTVVSFVVVHFLFIDLCSIRLLRFPVSSDYCCYSVSVIVGGKVTCNTCLRNMFLLGYKSILLRISVSILHFSVSFLNAGFSG